MGMEETVARREPWEVGPRVVELGLGSVDRLLRIRTRALSAAADATEFHPANAPGTLAYQYGTFALRDEYVGEIWKVDRQDGVEAISNPTDKVRVIFANIDVACNDDQPPKPRSRKGAGAERACSGNLFDYLPEFAPSQRDGWLTFYLMVDERGAAELTRPIVKNGTFTAYPERNYLSKGDDLGGDAVLADDEGPLDDFDPQVVKK